MHMRVEWNERRVYVEKSVCIVIAQRDRVEVEVKVSIKGKGASRIENEVSKEGRRLV